MIKRECERVSISYDNGHLVVFTPAYRDFGNILISEIDPNATEDEIYEQIASAGRMAPWDTPAAVSLRLLRDGYRWLLDYVNVSEFADEYYRNYLCNDCSNVTLDPSLLTDEFLERFLEDHYICLLRRLNRAPKFRITIRDDPCGPITNQEVADYVVSCLNRTGKISCLHESVIRAEWVDLCSKIPRRLMTAEQFIAELRDGLNDDDDPDIPDHLHCREVYEAIACFGDLTTIPITDETIGIIMDEYTPSFWIIVGRMTVRQAELALERYTAEDLGGFGTRIRFENLETAEFMVRRCQVTPTWTTAVAKHFLAIDDLAHMVPEYMRPSRAKSAR